MLDNPQGPTRPFPADISELAYCATTERGQLQLALSTKGPITPLALWVQIWHWNAVPCNDFMPKQEELWIEVPDAEKRSTIRDAITQLYPNIMSTKSESSQPDRFLDPKQALSSAWVPVGQWQYNLWGKDEQEFEIPVDLELLGVIATRFAVRVNSNWRDNDFTYLPQVEMKGIDRNGKPGKLRPTAAKFSS